MYEMEGISHPLHANFPKQCMRGNKVDHFRYFWAYSSVASSTLQCCTAITTIHLQNCTQLSIDSQFFLSPQPLAITVLLCISMNLITRYLIVHYLFFSDWLVSLSIMSSRSMQVVAGVRIRLFFLRQDNLMYVYTTFCLSFFLLMDIWVAYSAAENIGVHILVWIPAFNSFGYKPRSKFAGSYGNSM